jgi:hypothetical protein
MSSSTLSGITAPEKLVSKLDDRLRTMQAEIDAERPLSFKFIQADDEFKRLLYDREIIGGDLLESYEIRYEALVAHIDYSKISDKPCYKKRK